MVYAYIIIWEIETQWHHLYFFSALQLLPYPYQHPLYNSWLPLPLLIYKHKYSQLVNEDNKWSWNSQSKWDIITQCLCLSLRIALQRGWKIEREQEQLQHGSLFRTGQVGYNYVVLVGKAEIIQLSWRNKHKRSIFPKQHLKITQRCAQAALEPQTQFTVIGGKTRVQI